MIHVLSFLKNYDTEPLTRLGMERVLMNERLFIIMRVRDEKKQNAIIKTSIRLVNDLGFSGISISKIAEEAGVSPATIYIYYKNKEDLFTKIYISVRNGMSQASLKGIDDSKPIKDQFKLIWYNFFNYCIKHVDHLTYREHFEQILWRT